MKKITVFIVAVIVAASCSVSKPKEIIAPVIKLAVNPVVAHRGAWKKLGLPENSIASLRQAIALGCAGSEFDVRMTLDDSLIINHDPHYNKMDIEKTKYKDLIKIKLANGEVLPTLRQYLTAGLKDNTQTRIVCEIKPSATKERGKLIAERVVKLVKEMKADSMTVYISFDYDILKKVVELDPKAGAQYLEGNKTPEQLKADHINGADYYFTVFQAHPDWITSAKKNNIVLNAWTVNHADDMDWLLANGFDFITTNEPELLFERLKKPKPVTKFKKMVWSDEFNYKGLPDSTKWGYDKGTGCPQNCGWGNNELQYYTVNRLENTRVEDGKLIIEAKKEDFEGQKYTSTRLISRNKGDWKYGRFEIKAKLPEGKGMWPAIWMLPTKWAYGGWPHSGEIDIMENVGYLPDSVYGSVHTGAFNHVKGTQKTAGLQRSDLSKAFHVYGIEWTENDMTFFIDGTKYLTFPKGANSEEWPFDRDFHLLLNIAVGGNWGGKYGVDDSVFPQKMIVEYVRVYQ